MRLSTRINTGSFGSGGGGMTSPPPAPAGGGGGGVEDGGGGVYSDIRTSYILSAKSLIIGRRKRWPFTPLMMAMTRMTRNAIQIAHSMTTTPQPRNGIRRAMKP